ncbi:MAG: arginine--tRNA ligase, partial [Oscillospiraceae bacterium]|nr:arginine--tRNA ligase [Oscillospiraceae bacterium]
MCDNLISAAREQVSALTRSAYEKAAAQGLLPAGADIKGQVDIPKDVKNGDYATSFAMAGAKVLGKNPREIAQCLMDNMTLEGSYFDKVEMAGPGFLNFTLGKRWFSEVLAAVEAGGMTYGKSDEGKGKKVMVEFVSANPTGPMHIGNARGGVLGDTLADLLKRTGWEVWKEFYVNDFGNQVDKFAHSIYARCMQ